MMHCSHSCCVNGKKPVKNAFVIITKCPLNGKSKTRLSKSIGKQLTIDFCINLLKDLLLLFSDLQHSKYILYGPQSSKIFFKQLLLELKLENVYNLLPMTDNNLTTSNLSGKFRKCMIDLRQSSINGNVCIIASDTIALRPSHIKQSLEHTFKQKKAYIIPSTDGGYLMIDLPSNASLEVFEDVSWSASDTCVSQIKAIEKCNLDCIRYCSDVCDMFDVDEWRDWIRMCNYFGIKWNQERYDVRSESAIDIIDGLLNELNITKDMIDDCILHFPNVFAMLSNQM